MENGVEEMAMAEIIEMIIMITCIVISLHVGILIGNRFGTLGKCIDIFWDNIREKG